MVHQSDPDRRPDAEFEAGGVRHLVVGNVGRLLDPRRTPIRIVGLRPGSGQFVVEILAFEDAGATWEVPFEDVDAYQFEPTGGRASPDQIVAIADAIDRFDRPLVVPVDPAATRATARSLAALAAEARAWLIRESRFVASGARLDLTTRTGSPILATDLQQFLTDRDVADLEAAFAERYVRNPRSGDLVRGHRIVMAELGLVAYDDKVIREPGLFAGRWAKDRRARHILHRLAFVRAAYRLAGIEQVRLYRGLCLDGPLEPPFNSTFVSTSFDVEVARSCTGEADPASRGVLFRQPIAVDRLFMTYQETAQLNARYQEAEAVLLYDPTNPLF